MSYRSTANRTPDLRCSWPGCLESSPCRLYEELRVDDDPGPCAAWYLEPDDEGDDAMKTDAKPSTPVHDHGNCELCEQIEDERVRLHDAAELLWVALANVSGGDWTQQSREWQEVAARCRDEYFEAIKVKEMS